MSNIDFNRFLQRLSSVSEQTFIDLLFCSGPKRSTRMPGIFRRS